MYQAFPVSHIFHWFSHFPTFYQHPNFPCDSPIFWHSSATIFPYSFLLWFSTDLDYGFIVVPLFFHMLTFEVPICSHMISSYFHIFLEFSTAFPLIFPRKKKKLEKNPRRAATGLAKKRTRTMYTTPSPAVESSRPAKGIQEFPQEFQNGKIHGKS